MSGDSPGTDQGASGRSYAVDRRSVLRAVGTAGAASLAGCSTFGDPEDGDTKRLEGEAARDLAVQFAPTLYFDGAEQWFPTDPRPYASERDGKRVVNGFDALEGYVSRYREAGSPPDPVVFYNAVEYVDSPLAVVQFWLYSAFDQFSTNFHWHDWEVFHVFADVGGDAATPLLYVASSHSRSVPNNEFVDPDPDRVPRILSELGSHSSALSVNDSEDQFQRLGTDGLFADITNGKLSGVNAVRDVPLAYGLPRDEGFHLPYLVPELDGAPLYEHDRLPSVRRSDLIPEELTIRSLGSLLTPPSLPERENGVVFRYTDRSGGDDVAYDLAPTADLEGIDDFTGSQLSFEFYVPGFVEDAVASHITTTSVPWTSERYDNPAADITDADHRLALAEEYDAIGKPPSVRTLVAAVSETVSDPDAPDGAGVTTEEPTNEAVVLVESDPEAVPTFTGVVAVRDVPEGEHRMTVNGAGLAPHSESVAVEGESGPTAAGVEGEVPLVARENATKVSVDPSSADSDLTDLAIEDDFGGRLYDAPLSGRDAVYVHRGGAYTTELRDADDAVGAVRVNPAETDRVEIADPSTGTASLASYLAELAAETRSDVAAATGVDLGDTKKGDGRDSAGPVRGLLQALEAVEEAARRAAERARNGNGEGADRSLRAVADRLDRLTERLSEARGELPPEWARATDRRLEQANRRAKQARNAQKL